MQAVKLTIARDAAKIPTGDIARRLNFIQSIALPSSRESLRCPLKICNCYCVLVKTAPYRKVTRGTLMTQVGRVLAGYGELMMGSNWPDEASNCSPVTLLLSELEVYR